MVVRLTPNLPPIPPLHEALATLRAVTPEHLALLAYVVKLRPPPPPLVVAYGVLCVLFDVPTTWKSAVATASDPDLINKLTYLSSLSPGSTRPVSPSVTRPDSAGAGAGDSLGFRNSAYNLYAASGLDSIDAAGSPTAGVRPPSAGIGSSGKLAMPSVFVRAGITPETAPPVYPELRLTPECLSLARKLLNKRPDIRAEVRCMRMSIEPAAGTGSTDPVSVPFVALIALVEWEVSFILHATVRQRMAARSRAASAQRERGPSDATAAAAASPMVGSSGPTAPAASSSSRRSVSPAMPAAAVSASPAPPSGSSRVRESSSASRVSPAAYPASASPAAGAGIALGTPSRGQSTSASGITGMRPGSDVVVSPDRERRAVPRGEAPASAQAVPGGRPARSPAAGGGSSASYGPAGPSSNSGSTSQQRRRVASPSASNAAYTR